MSINNPSVFAVNGQQGDVVLSKVDIGLDQVDNTSDANKPVSTATSTALGLKVDKTITVSAGTSLNGGGDLSANRTINHNNFGTAGTYGSASSVPVFVTEETGHITSVVSTAIQITQSQVTGLGTDLSGKANLVGGNTFTAGAQILTPTNPTDNALAVTQGRVLIGSTTAQDITGASIFPNFQILGVSATQMVAAQYSADVNPPAFNLLKSRGTLNNQGLVLNNDEIGRLQFRASDGTNFEAAASIRALVDGTAANDSMPGRLVFLTTSSGSVTPTERMIIDSNGNVGINTVTNNTSALLQLDSTTKGFLPPRMTSTQRDAITTPATGLRVFDTTLNTECYYDGTVWLFEVNKFTTTTQSTTSATYGAVAELVTPVLPAGRYTFSFVGTGQSTNGGIGIGFRLGPGSATIGAIVANWSISQAANGQQKNYEYSQIATTTNVTSNSAPAANTDFPVVGDGVFSISVAGTVQIEIRSGLVLTGVSIRANSFLQIKRLS